MGRLFLTGRQAWRFDFTAADLALVVDRFEDMAPQALLPRDKVSAWAIDLSIDDRAGLAEADHPLRSVDRDHRLATGDGFPFEASSGVHAITLATDRHAALMSSWSHAS